MIKTTTAYKEAIKKNRIFHHKVNIKFADQTNMTVDDIDLFTFQLSDATSNTNSFDIGSAIAQQLSLKLNNVDGKFDNHDFSDAVITAKIGLELSDNSIEWLNKGIFTAEPGTVSGDTISVNTFDNMVKFDTDYSQSKLVYPATLGAIVRDACSCCGVTLAPDTATFDKDGYVVQNRPNDSALTFRQVLQFVGQISCTFFKINTEGKLSAKWYDTDTLESIDMNNVNTEKVILIDELHTGSTLQTDDVVITGIKVVEENGDEENSNSEVTYKSGTDGYVLEVSGNKLIQDGKGAEVVNYLGEHLNGLQFRPVSINASTDPCRESGDLAVIVDSKGNKYKTIFTNVNYVAHTAQALICDAEVPTRLSSTRYSQATQVYKEIRANIRKYRTEWSAAFKELQTAMDSKNGLFPVSETQEDGSTILYFCDKPALKDSSTVIKLSVAGWGMSTDGGKTWNVGTLVDGTTITKILNAVGINANWINTGALTVKDDDGNIVFQVDVDSKTATISGNLYLGGGNNKRGILNILDESGTIKTVIDKDGIRHFDSSSKIKPYHYRAEHCTLKLSQSDFSGGGQQLCIATTEFLFTETTLSEEFWMYFQNYGADAIKITASFKQIASPGDPSSNGIYALGTFGIRDVSLYFDDTKTPCLKVIVECSYINYGFNNMSPRYIKPKGVYLNIDIVY
ncbi:MAG: hypothetical protein ACLT1Q_08165 [Anaerobutyricum soehngenii]